MNFLKSGIRVVALASATALAVPAFADDNLAAATAYYERAFKGECETVAELTDRFGAQMAAPRSYDISFKRPYSDTPERVELYQFLCRSSAYNTVHVFITKQYGALMPVAFAEPTYDVSYKGEGNEDVKEIKLRSYSATHLLINASFDEERQEIVSYSKSRGLGDAYTSGLWAFKQGRFELQKYEIDASYDQKASPQMILNFGVPSE